jgi:chorismate dehydratase
VALDTSSHTSVALTKVIFREFFEREPVWTVAAPDVDSMLTLADAALMIGDPALSIAAAVEAGSDGRRVFDLAELWDRTTGLGFVFAMWMTSRDRVPIDLALARDEGLEHIEDIVANYAGSLGIERDVLAAYLRDNIVYTIDEPMRRGMELFFELAAKHRLTPANRPLMFTV